MYVTLEYTMMVIICNCLAFNDALKKVQTYIVHVHMYNYNIMCNIYHVQGWSVQEASAALGYYDYCGYGYSQHHLTHNFTNWDP